MSKSVLYMSMSLDGEGRPLFAQLGAQHVALTPTRVLDAPGVTHLRYEVPRAGR